jgi:hypothetical protein
VRERDVMLKSGLGAFVLVLMMAHRKSLTPTSRTTSGAFRMPTS